MKRKERMEKNSNNIWVDPNSLDNGPSIEHLNGHLNIIEGNERPEPLNVNSTTSTATIGHLSVANGTTNTFWPYYYQYYPYSYQTVKAPWVAIEKADNGFIVMKEGKTFVCKNVKEITALLSKKEKNGKD